MKPGTEQPRSLRVGTDESLPMLTREFSIMETAPGFKPWSEAEKSAREKRNADRVAKKAARVAAHEAPDPADDLVEDLRGASDSDLLNISISSEYPVQRWYGTEILDHSAGSVDLTRAKLGMSYLVEHTSRELVGIIDNVRVDADKVLRGQVRFSRSPQAQQVKADILDGIRRFISVGYMVNEYVTEKSSKTEGDTYRATKWTPMEASSVAVPADPTVGQNRSDDKRQFPVVVRSSIDPASKPNIREVPVEKELTAVEQIAARNTAVAEILRLGKLHAVDSEISAKAISEGRSVADFSAIVLDEVAKRAAKPIPQPAAEGQERISLTDKEQKQYNIARGIMAMINNKERGERNGEKHENCLELEISQTIEKRMKTAGHGGLYVPYSIRHESTEIQKRAGLDTVTATAGAELKFTEPGEFIQFLYNRMRVKELGARTLTGLRDNIAFPKQTGRATGSWVAENPGTDVADSALTLGTILASPKTYQSSTSYSRQLLAQAVIDIDTLVREDLARDQALAIDTAALSGTGSSNQPTGILHTTGVQSFVLAADSANGGVVTWDDLIKLSELLEDANADQLGSPAWLTTPGIKSSLKRTARLGNTIGLPIWADNDTINGEMARSTNQLPKNGTKGSGSNLNTMIRGVFEMMMICMWGSGFELIVDPYRLKKQGMIELTTFMLVDIVIKYPQAFAVATDVITI